MQREPTNINKNQYEKAEAWGLLASVDLYECNPETIRDAEAIKRFVVELCERIDMRRYGDCQVVHFGDDPKVSGFSMTQLIETSLISAHFANESNTTYLDVFSCKYFEPSEVALFSQEFFGAKEYILNVTLRK
jgi:S-adenosylmethionine decarboxylase